MRTSLGLTTCLTMASSTPGFIEESKRTRKKTQSQVSRCGSPGSIGGADKRIDQPDLLLSTEMLPADEQDFDDWYRQEHLVDGSKISGWRRTERYELFNALRTEDAPKYLTLVGLNPFRNFLLLSTLADDEQLFLDGPSISMKDLEKAGSSEWTQKIVGGMKKMRTGAYQKSTHHVADDSSNATPISSSL